jgi:hypothetical protein
MINNLIILLEATTFNSHYLHPVATISWLDIEGNLICYRFDAANERESLESVQWVLCVHVVDEG